MAERINSDEALVKAYGVMTFLYSERAAADTITAMGVPKPNYDSALYYLHKAEPIARRIEKPFDLLVLDVQLGQSLLRRKDRKALAYFQEALDISKEINKPYEQVRLMLTLADAHLLFDKPQAAYGFLERANKLRGTLSHEDRGIVRGLEHIYAQYYQTMGNLKAALEHTQKLHELQKQDYLADRDGAVTRLGMEYESEKK